MSHMALPFYLKELKVRLRILHKIIHRKKGFFG
jgi:hypothetical protein